MPVPTAEEMRAAEQLRADSVKEWSQYVAADDITINGVLAVLKGQAVAASNVTSGVYTAEQVVKTTTKAGQALIEKEV